MEDNPQTPSTTTPPAARTAQALRELHDRARNALAAQRERMGRLEAQLTHQLDTIADTLSGQIAAHGGATTGDARSLQEVERLRAELERTRVEWNTERDTWQAERSQLLAADNDRLQTMEERQRELESRQVTLDERATELNHQDREQRQRQELLDSYAAQCAEQQSQLTATESALDKQRADIAAREAELERTRTEHDQAQAARSTHDATYQEQLSALAAEREAITAERNAAAAESGAVGAEREALANEQASLTADRAAFQLERVAFEAERDAFNEQVNAHSSLHQEGGAADPSELEQQFQTERTAWERERASVDEQRRLLAKDRDDLAKALEAARNELATARETAGAATERDELQQKFALALEDVQRLRARAAEMEQELASRPASSEADSLELVHLRAERDALAERIGELEQDAANAGGASSADDSELQRRFELAVEDVRDLKKRNADLESQMAAAKAISGVANPSVGGSSWEAMKKKMLANLEDEGGDVDDERVDERETIANTIRITDDALARKDREIADLKSQLSSGTSAIADAEQTISELVDADEVIAEHRSRIAKLEQEMQDKLRAAELELSVERAKIARETSQLADLKAELESQRANHEVDSAASSVPGGAQQPKRRWLSKLGLSGDDQG